MGHGTRLGTILEYSCGASLHLAFYSLSSTMMIAEIITGQCICGASINLAFSSTTLMTSAEITSRFHLSGTSIEIASTSCTMKVTNIVTRHCHFSASINLAFSFYSLSSTMFSTVTLY
jgi:hypothetical protein